MGTRSFIGVQNPNKTFTAIYCHWDGYPSNNGVILDTHYTDPAKVADLMRLGDISALGKDIGIKHTREDNERDMCLAYGRDLDDDSPTKSYHTEREFIEGANDHTAEYVYLFKDGKWYCMSTFYDAWKWVSIPEILKKLKDLDRK